jgi:sugar lactone lactonase YvrE
MAQPRIHPVRWHPPKAPARARRSTGPVPLPEVRVFDIGGEGPEDVLVDPGDGSVLTGVVDGRILRLQPSDGAVTQVADTGGRPLGLEWLPDGRLLVCDAHRGLLAVAVDSGAVTLLADSAGGQPIRFCNNAAVTADGTIFFSDSSQRFGIEWWKADILEHSGTGRLLRRDPAGEVHVVADGLHFPNGVALAGDPAQLFLASTGSYDLQSMPTDPDAATFAPVLPNLPGFPDNMATGTDGLVWLAKASPRNPVVDLLAPLPGPLRQLVWALPEALQPKPKDQIWVVAVDPDSGRVVHDLQGSHPAFGLTTGVREHAGTVWLGSLVATTLACFDL